MIKPKNWENTQGYGEFKPLELGGHICRIMKVEEAKTKSTGKDMIIIYLDIAEGKQMGYYSEMFKGDSRENKKWGCVVYQLIEDNDGNTNKGFKTFIIAVEKSNSNFNESEIWNEGFCNYFKNKLIGGIFGREQYRNSQGALKWSTKCQQFRDIETIKNGVEVPEDKYLPDARPDLPQGFTVTDIDESELPF